mgnify:FL=1
MFKKYDRVKIIDVPEDNPELYQLIGKEATIIDVDRDYEYPYEVVFLDKRSQDINEWHGILLFADRHLELSDEPDIESAKAEIRELINSLWGKRTVHVNELLSTLRRIERML